jgi:hypothetical protein
MCRLLAAALLTTILCACSTPPAEPVQPRLPAALVAACDPLPKLDVAPGADLRPAILENRVESERVHAECAARHRAVVEAVNPRQRETRERRTHRSE